uniref:BHLH domain-containing protein n=1 Tax=Salarias fasciatus TaxID=181472 RepID=A0A672JUQ1_SALFA
VATREMQKYRRPPANVKQEQDDDSDTEEPQLGLRRADGLESQIIHSGHFMVSSPHSEHPPKKGYDFDTVNKQTCQTYHFGKASTSHFSIDASLTKLFECMTLAYSGKLVSPKWKNFRGLKLLWRDKIRLNNAIWRAWYMQYVERRENPVCHFVTPLDGNMDLDVHRPAEAIATEGKCWKRRIEIVIREYHKWRAYFKKRLQKHKDEDLSSLLTGPEEQFSLFGEVSPDMLRVSIYQDEETAARRMPRKHNEAPAPMEMDPLFDMDVLMSEFSDTLFSTLASHQPISWPNPREIAHAGNADMIQPGLIPLQPNLDFMDSFDSLQGSRTAPARSSSSPTDQLIVHTVQKSSAHVLVTLLQPSLTSPTGASGDAGYVQRYMPLFPGQVAPSDQAAASPAVPQTLARDHLAQCLPGQDMSSAAAAAAAAMVPSPLNNPPGLDEAVPSTHTAASAVTASDTATTFSRSSEFSSIPSQAPAPPSQLQPLALLPSTPVQQRQTFALPQVFHSSGANKSRPVQRIAPANTLPSSHLILTGLWSFFCRLLLDFRLLYFLDIVISYHFIACSVCTVCNLSTTAVKQSRRTHISAEQKRRSNINFGFKTLCNLVPALKSQPNISNAITLQKTVEYIGKLQQDRQQMQEEARRLREEIEELNSSINVCQEQLPATGVPVRRHHFDHMQEKFNEYVKSRTLQNWKFWIFSIIIKPLFESFNGMVSTTSRAELCHSTLQWLDRHCSLPALRPMVLSTLRQLSTSTSILNDPSLLPDEAIQASFVASSIHHCLS